MKNPELNVPCPIRHNNIYDYAIPIKGTTSLNLAEVKTNITLALTKLREILVEKAVPRVAISRSLKIENLAWPEIFDILKKTLANIETKIFICLNIIKYPLESEKQQIIEENHCSAVGGHRGQNKTIKRIQKNTNGKD